MRKKTVIPAHVAPLLVAVLLVTVLSCAAFSEPHPSQYGWKERHNEKFSLSNRAKRRLPLEIAPIGGSDTVFLNLQLSSKFPVDLSLQDERGASVGSCRYADVTDLEANCTLKWDPRPKYLVIEDMNQAGITRGTKGADALNRVTLTISDYVCEKNCPKPR